MKAREIIENKFLSGIYKITNLINNKCYIGQSKHVSRRIQEHISSAHRVTAQDYNYPIHCAFRKYGLDNFDFELLESTTDLNIREQYYVNLFDSRKNGYNQTDGGYQSIRQIKLTKDDVIRIIEQLKTTLKPLTQIAEEFDISADFVSDINFGNSWFDETINYPVRSAELTKLCKSYCVNQSYVEQLDKSFNLISVFKSANDAGTKLAIRVDHITETINGKRKSAGGFYWRKVPVSDTEFIKMFSSK